MADGIKSEPHQVLETVVGLAQARDRERNAVAGTRVSFTWPEPVHEITVNVLREAATDDFTALAVAFGAPDGAGGDPVADAWLTSLNSGSSDAGRKLIRAGYSRTFFFGGDGITRMDAIRAVGGTALTVSVEAA